jgi:hypothetical protein
MRLRRIAPVALLLVVGGVGAWFLRREVSSARSASPDSALTPDEHVAMLDSSLRALEDGVRDARRDRWDPAYVVEKVGQDPDSLYRWVHDNTAWIPYRGSLRGPVGVLMDRQGNSLDRALLLANLLQRAGHTVRLARTVIPLERAAAMLPEQASKRPREVGGDVDLLAEPPVSISEAAGAYGLDGKAIEQTLESFDEATAELVDKVEQRVAVQSERLLRSVDGLDPSAEWTVRADSALAMLRDHWWVQLNATGSWQDLDLVRLDTMSVPMAAPIETLESTGVDSALHHQVTIRVVTERFTAGRLVEERVLEHTLRPSEMIGRSIVLQFWPTAWQPRDSMSGSARTLRLFAMEQDQWRASLVIAGDAVAEATLEESTRSADRATGSLGGLGGAMTRALDTRRDEEDSVLTAASIEYVMDVPGRASRVLRRSVFDLIGPAARQAGVAAPAFDERHRLDRSLSLMMRTEILPVVAQPNADFVAHLAAQSVLANADLLRALSHPGFGPYAAAMDSLLNTAQPGVGPLYALAALRHHANGTTAFIDQPAILTRHRYPRVDGDSIALADAADIVANEMGIGLRESDGFAARVVQGVWDTNLEALLGLAGGPVGNAAAAFDANRNWRTLTRDDRERLPELRLPADALTRIGHDLDSGYTVVVPERPITVDRRQFTAWWRIHPRTGDALGIGENGWGQGSEYSLTTNIIIVGGRAFVFEYGLCQFIPQMANSLRVIGGEFWRLGIAPSWTRPPEPGKDFEDVAVENNRMCLKQAMLAGFLATAPLLISTARYSVLARIQRSALQREAIANMRQATRFCLCIRGPAGGLTRAQARGGPIIPKGGGDAKMIDPLGKTQPAGRAPDPGKTLDLGKTQPNAQTPGMTMRGMGRSRAQGPYPRSMAEAERNRQAAYDAYYRAANNSSEHTGNWIRYRFEHEYHLRKVNPDAPIPDFLGDDFHSELAAKMNQASTATDYELTRAIEADKKLEWAYDAARKGEIPWHEPASPTPGSSSCIPSCSPASSGSGSGSAPASRPSGSLEVGSAGVSRSFFQGRWPTGNR